MKLNCQKALDVKRKYAAAFPSQPPKIYLQLTPTYATESLSVSLTDQVFWQLDVYRVRQIVLYAVEPQLNLRLYWWQILFALTRVKSLHTFELNKRELYTRIVEVGRC